MSYEKRARHAYYVFKKVGVLVVKGGARVSVWRMYCTYVRVVEVTGGSWLSNDVGYRDQRQYRYLHLRLPERALMARDI